MLRDGQVPKVAARRLGAPIPEALQAFLDRALAFSPDDRPQSAAQFVERLREALSGVPQEQLDARPEGAAEEPEQSMTSQPGATAAPGVARLEVSSPAPKVKTWSMAGAIALGGLIGALLLVAVLVWLR
jgi:serine/threonine-protein kinase